MVGFCSCSWTEMWRTIVLCLISRVGGNVLMRCFHVLLVLSPLLLQYEILYKSRREMKPVSVHFTPLFHFFWQRIKEFTLHTRVSVSSKYKSQLACLSSSATAFFPPLTFLFCPANRLVTFSSLFFPLFVFLCGSKCVRAHLPNKSISRCVYEVRLYSVWLTLKRAGAERLIFASLI